MDARFAFDTGAGFNIICRAALEPGWEYKGDEKAKPPRLSIENGRPLRLGKSVGLTMRLSNTLYREKLIVAERLAVEVIVETAVLNHNVLRTFAPNIEYALKRGTFHFRTIYRTLKRGKLTIL